MLIRQCVNCLTEKLWIINQINDNNILNKKSELINKCRNLNKFLLKHVQKKQKQFYTCKP